MTDPVCCVSHCLPSRAYNGLKSLDGARILFNSEKFNKGVSAWKTNQETSKDRENSSAGSGW